MNNLPVIKNIYWKKTRLFLSIGEMGNETGVVPVLTNGAVSYPFRASKTENGDYFLDVCNVGDGEMLPPDNWLIQGFVPDVCLYEKLEDLDKALVYGGHNAYIVRVSVNEEGIVQVYTDFMRRKTNYKKRGTRNQIITDVANTAYKVFRALQPGKRKNILFLSETRTTMSDNFKAVYNRMLERGLDKKYKIEFLMDMAAKEGNHSYKKYNKLWKIAGSNYIFVDDYSPFFSVLNPPEDVKLIQLWHAGFGYKAVGYDRFGLTGSPHPYQSCHRRYDIAICGNDALREVYAGVFGISEDRIFATGMPRLEEMTNPEHIEDVRKKLFEQFSFLEGKRVILFAPTYRGASQKDAHYDWSMIDQKALGEMLRRTNSVMLLKFHPFIEDGFQVDREYDDVIFDLSKENINELICVTDVLITDYSSCFYDFLVIRKDKPILFYIFDEDEFTSLRGICKPVSETCPGPVIRTKEELVKVLEQDSIPMPTPKPYMLDMGAEAEIKPSDRVIDLVFGEGAGK